MKSILRNFTGRLCCCHQWQILSNRSFSKDLKVNFEFCAPLSLKSLLRAYFSLLIFILQLLTHLTLMQNHQKRNVKSENTFFPKVMGVWTWPSAVPLFPGFNAFCFEMNNYSINVCPTIKTKEK